MTETHSIRGRPRRTNALRKLHAVFAYYLDYYGWHRGNKVSFLQSRGMHIGTGCDILTSVRNFGSEPWLIEIGSHVTITDGVRFVTHDGSSRLFRHQLSDASRYGNRFGVIIVHDNCFIGLNSILLPDVTVGPNSIIGAGSIVNENVPKNTVVAGVPARVICTLDEYIDRYREKMIPISATTRDELRDELSLYFWNESR